MMMKVRKRKRKKKQSGLEISESEMLGERKEKIPNTSRDPILFVLNIKVNQWSKVSNKEKGQEELNSNHLEMISSGLVGQVS